MEPMSERLEQLGGGRAALSKAHVHARVCNPAVRPAAGGQVVHTAADGRSIRVRNPRADTDCPDDQCSRTFSLDAVQAGCGAGSAAHVLLHSLLSGFSSLVLSIGQQKTGKSHLLFEHCSSIATLDAVASESHTDGYHSPLCDWLIFSLFDELHRIENDAFRLAISAWDIGADDRCTDLLATRQARSNSGFTPAAIRLRDHNDIRQALAHARSASRNWAYSDNGTLHVVPNKGHSVVKLQVWRQSRGQYCTLHVVDTVGSQCASSQAHLANRSKNNERMQASRHLLALSRTLSEFAQSSDFTVSDAAPPRPFNARECRLSELVGTLLARDGVRLFLLPTISPHAEDYLDTMNTLRIATQAREIRTASVTQQAVSLQSLNFELLSDVCRRKHVAQQETQHDIEGKVKDFVRESRLHPDERTSICNHEDLPEPEQHSSGDGSNASRPCQDRASSDQNASNHPETREYENDPEQLHEKLRTLRADLSRSSDTKRTMDASRPKVGQSEGEDAFKKIETLLQQLNTAEKSVAERDGKIKELENELLEAQTAKDLNSDNERKYNLRKQGMLKEPRDQISLLQAYEDELERSESKRMELEKEIMRLRFIGHSKVESEQSQQKAHKVERPQKTIEKLQREKHNLEHTIRGMQKNIRVAEIKHEESKRDRERLEQQEAKSEEERKKASEAHSKMKEQTQELDQLQADNRKLQEDVNKLKSEKKKLRSELDMARRNSRRHPCVSSQSPHQSQHVAQRCGKALSCAKKLQRMLPASAPQAERVMEELVRELNFVRDHFNQNTFTSYVNPSFKM